MYINTKNALLSSVLQHNQHHAAGSHERTAEEGVDSCHSQGDPNTPVSNFCQLKSSFVDQSLTQWYLKKNINKHLIYCKVVPLSNS